MAAVYKYNSMNKLSVQNDRTSGFTTKQWDDFCWSCHRDKPTMFCTSCIRSYHAAQFCSGSKKLTADEKQVWKCPACIDIQTDVQRMHTKRIDAKDVSKMLSLVLDRIKSDENFTDALMTIDYTKVSGNVVKRMDLNIIEQNIDDFIYRCYETFLLDIKWIVHNVKIYNELVINSKVNATKIVKWLLDMTKEEIYSIRMCHECYVGIVQNHRFDMVCKHPHLIVWAKQKGYPYWPAKLMSVSAAKNTVEVRYFGEKHFRAIIAPKDCYMYSAERPSLHLGAHKKAFEKAQVEVSSYIKRIGEIYGPYTLATTANTPLNARMLERHLYDTIPDAWMALGKINVPPPIPTVIAAAAARISRRHSIASRLVITPPPPPQSASPVNLPNPVPNTGGRIMTRRMSSRNFNGTNEHDVDDYSEIDGGAKRTKKVATRRQSVQVDMLDSKKRNFWNDTDTHGERISSLSGTTRKRKISKDNDEDTAPKQSTSKSTDAPIFKVPVIPRKVRKMSTTAQEIATHENGDTVTSHQNTPPANDESSSTKKSNGHGNSENGNQSPDMDILFNTCIENNTAKMTDYMQTLMNGMLHEFWNGIQTQQPQLQILQNQLQTMQSDYERQIGQLKRENTNLKQKVKTMTGKFDEQLAGVRELVKNNAELKSSESEAKLKMAALTMDLRKAVASNTDLTADLKEMSKQNADYDLVMVKMKTQHEAAQKMLIDAESKVTLLQAQNKVLNDKNNGLDVSLQWAVKQYQETLGRLKRVESACNSEKSAIYEQCYRMVNENKKKQWCAVCLQQGSGRHYCSSKCEAKHRKQNR